MNLKIRILFAFSLMFLSYNVFANNRALPAICAHKILSDTIPVDNDSAYVRFEKVEEEASFAGGEKAWRQYLENNLDPTIPVKKKAPAGTYTVVVQFIIDKEGYVSDVKALTNHGFGMEEEVVRLIKKSPKWVPAKQNGRIVKAYRKQPVTFQVEEKKKKKKKNKDD